MWTVGMALPLTWPSSTGPSWASSPGCAGWRGDASASASVSPPWWGAVMFLLASRCLMIAESEVERPTKETRTLLNRTTASSGQYELGLKILERFHDNPL